MKAAQIIVQHIFSNYFGILYCASSGFKLILTVHFEDLGFSFSWSKRVTVLLSAFQLPELCCCYCYCFSSLWVSAKKNFFFCHLFGLLEKMEVNRYI